MSLEVQMHGEPIGELIETADRGYCFAYAPEMLAREGEGAVLISNSLPLRADPYGPEESRPYFEGLLPAGLRRQRVGAEHGIMRDDEMALLGALGRDCPGAVTFPTRAKTIAFQAMIREAKSGRPASTGWLAEAELEQQMWEAPRWRFDPLREELMLYTLPGPRRKLALVRDDDGDRWSWPEWELPSTHVVKPETGEPKDLVVNEVACILACREAGVPVARTELREIAGQRCLLSGRYDRRGGGERVHQESFAQALGVAPGEVTDAKPGIAEACRLLRSVGDPGGAETLFLAAVCGLLLGSGKPPGRAFSLLYTDRGPQLAPCCGIYSTEVYERAELVPLNHSRPPTASFEDSAELPLVLDASSQLPSALLPAPPPPPAPFREALTATVTGCGLELRPGLARAAEIAGPLCAALDAVAGRARGEGWHEPVIDRIVELAGERRREVERAAAE